MKTILDLTKSCITTYPKNVSQIENGVNKRGTGTEAKKAPKRGYIKEQKKKNELFFIGVSM